MRKTILTLLALCCLAFSSRAKERDLYALAGTGKMFRDNRSGFCGNLGIRRVVPIKWMYIDFAFDLYYQSSSYLEPVQFWQPYRVIAYHNDGQISAALGAGFRLRRKKITIKAGANIGYQLSMTEYDSYLAYNPQATIDHAISPHSGLGLMFKYNAPVYAPGKYGPRLFLAGLMFRF